MKKIFFVSVLFFFESAIAQQNYSSIQDSRADTVSSGFRASGQLDQAFNYNVFYDDEKQLTDLSTGVTPTLGYNLQGKTVGIRAIAEGRYEKFYNYSVQDHFDYNGKVEIPLSTESGYQVKASGEYKAFSERAESATGKRYGRTQAIGTFDGALPISTTKKLSVHGTALLDSYAEPEQERLNHMAIEGVGIYEQNFLPETRWFLRGTGGITDYPTGTVSKPEGFTVHEKYNSYYAMGEAGVRGRLTEKTMIDAAFGYQFRSYEDAGQTRFNEPVFYVNFIEQMSHRDQLMGGFNYVVQEAAWSNYYTDQEIFIGFGRLVGDQLLILSRFSYTYRTYSPNSRRDDQRVMASFSGRYSLNRNIKLVADFYADIVNSDAYALDLNNTGIPDRATNYKAGRLSLGVVGEF